MSLSQSYKSWSFLESELFMGVEGGIYMWYPGIHK